MQFPVLISRFKSAYYGSPKKNKPDSEISPPGS